MPRKKLTADEPTPLRLVKRFAQEFQGCYDKVEFVRKGRGNGLPMWDDLCYVPIAGTLSIMELYGHIEKAAELTAFSSWRQYKEIYSFDADLRDTLYEQSDDIVVPVEILRQLPYPCIYIQTSEENENGFFVHFEDDENSGFELRFLEVENDDSCIPYTIHLKKGWTIQQGIDDALKFTIESRNRAEVREHFPNAEEEQELFQQYGKDMFDCSKERICKLIQLVLYVCADNIEVEENPRQKPITRKPQAGERVRDAFREIRKWDVGFRVGSNIRKYKAKSPINNDNADVAYSANGTTSGTSKRPHARRGHWHHYWIGSEKDSTKKITLKWIAPMFINGGEDDIITTTIEL